MDEQLETQYEILGQALVDGVGGPFVEAWIEIKLTDDYAEYRAFAEVPGRDTPMPLRLDGKRVRGAFRRMRELMSSMSGGARFTTATFRLHSDHSVDLQVGYDPV